MEITIHQALNWIDSDTVLAEKKLPQLVDKAFFYHMLINRFPQSKLAAEWKASLQKMILTAYDVVDIESFHTNTPRSFPEKYELCNQVDALLMLGYLGYSYKMDWHKTYAEEVLELIGEHKEDIFNISFLFNYTYDYLLKEQGLPVPSELQINEGYQYLDDETSFIIKSYYYTHILLFNSAFFKKKVTHDYKKVIDHIKESTDKVLSKKYTDLIGEYIWCLQLCNETSSEQYKHLANALISLQDESGFWSHSSYDIKSTRHATYVGIIALLGMKEEDVLVN
jgi:hypothetical protein